MRRHLLGLCLLLLNPMLLPGQAQNTQLRFEKHIIDSDLQSPYWVHIADQEGDQDLDLVTASGDGIEWWLNNDGNFSKMVVGSFQGAWSVHAADIDNDGDMDAMGASSGVDEFAIWRTSGNSFNKIHLGSGLGAESIYAGDLDHDGDQDILGAIWEEGRIHWWQNDGSGRFAEKVLDNDMRNAHSVFAADLDMDGRVDGIATGIEGTRWYRNKGDGTFTTETIHDIGGWCVFAGDIDGDGDNDLIRTQRNNGDVVLFVNEGNATFAEKVIEPAFGECWSIAIGDVDGDGNNDIVGSAFDNHRIVVWLSLGGTNFEPALLVDAANEPRGIHVADLDNDGDADIAAAIRGDLDLVWYEVLASPKRLTVLSPNGGEILSTGTSFDVRWDTSGRIDEVVIEFSPDDGNSWTTLRDATSNTGFFNWTVPAIGTQEGRIRIVDSSGAGVNDLSDNTFAIAQPALTFTDITLSAGAGGPEAAGETGGHAAIFADVNNDGLPDLFYTMLFDDPMADLFFRNQGNRSFVNEGGIRGLSDFDGGSHGAVWADLDNDGDYDLYNGTTFGSPGIPSVNNIFRNNGSGFFVDVTTTSGIPQREWPTRGVTAFDMDRDGDLDLLAITNFEGSADPPDERNELYRNDGGMQFTAINSGALYTAPAGQGVTDADYDGDGDIDIFAANRTGNVNILQNDGSGNFTLLTPASLGIFHQAPDGITTGDIDNDGDLDLLLSGNQSANLYRNHGNGLFTHISTISPIDGYMGTFGDLDNDGDLDLVIAGNSLCYLNNGAGHFTVGPPVPVAGINDPRAVAMADIDNDGDLDFAFGAKRSRNWLVRNNLNSGTWLKIKLISPDGQAGAFGAKTRLYPAGQAGGQLLAMRESRGSNGYLGQNDPVLHFGLNGLLVVDVEVTFPNGTKVTRSNVIANRIITIDARGQGPAPVFPVVSAFVPVSGPIGTEVTIVGQRFSTVTSVRFNGTSATNFRVDSDTQIRATLPAGASTGKIQVTNPSGSASSSSDFTVTSSGGGGGPATFTFNPTDDAYVRSSRPTDNYGDLDEIRARQTSVDRQSYLKFQVSGLSGQVQSAVLKLFVIEESDDGGSIHAVSNNYLESSIPWDERTLTWENAPGISGQALSSSGSVSLSETIEFDVTAAINGNGTFSFGLKNESSDIVRYSSKEGAVPPALVIVTSAGSNPAPSISSFSPTSGGSGTEVTIVGANLAEALQVTFDHKSAPTFVIDSPGQVRAIVPSNPTSGPVRISTPYGVATSSINFIVAQQPEPPDIASFSPASGPVGTTVSIFGAHFFGATEVQFNGRGASSFSVVSDTQVRATVPPGAGTGPITLTTPDGSITTSSFFIVTDPPITDPPSSLTLEPSHDTFVRSTEPTKNYGGSGELRVRKTSSTDYYTFLKFDINGIGGPPARAVLRLTAIDDGSEGGSVYVVSNNYGSSATPWTEDDLHWQNAPPLSGTPIASIGSVSLNQVVEVDVTAQISGDGVYSFAFENSSSDAVKYSSKEGPAAPQLLIGGAGNGTNGPEISSFSPSQGSPGSTVTISGSHLNGVTGVAFNGVSAVFTGNSDWQVLAIVPTGADTGPISLSTPGGTTTSSSSFMVLHSPELNSFSPASGPAGSTVTILGNHFSGATAVTFNGSLASFSLDSDTRLRATVPSTATTGPITVMTNAGSATSSAGFQVTQASNPPVISAFVPTSGPVGTQVTIVGNGFSGVTRVTFNETDATSFSLFSATEIRAIVPSGATSGRISITNDVGTTLSGGDFNVVTNSTTLSFPPSDDTFIKSDDVIKNYGDVRYLRIRQPHSDHIRAYLKFNVSGITGAVIRAFIRFHVIDPGDEAGSIYLVDNNYEGSSTPWREGELIWNNAPVITGTPLSFVAAVDLDEMVEFDVTTAVSADGIYSFAIANSSSEIVLFSSKEGTTAPELVIELNSGEASNAPSISSFSPPGGASGSTVIVSGSHFTGATHVTFGGANATFSEISDSELHAIVPSSAPTGKIGVTTIAGTTVTASDFVVQQPPNITGFSPTAGPVGSDVFLTGTNFTNVSEVFFDGVETAFFIVVSPTQITARAPHGSTTGLIQVSNNLGSDFSDQAFTVTEAQNVLTFSPTDDSFTRVASETKNYGGSADLRVRLTSSDVVTTYLKFNVSGAGSAVTSAVLRLHVIDDTDEGGGVYSVSNNFLGTSLPWTEEELNAANAPEVSGAALSLQGSAGIGETVELDVTEAISGDGIYSFALRNSSSDVVRYSTKEGIVAPKLVIETGAALLSKNAGQDSSDGAEERPEYSIPTPDKIELKPNYPNPFNIETTIQYSVTTQSRVRIAVYNIRGQEIKELINTMHGAGFHSIRWDGRDAYAREASSGIYLVRLEIGEQSLVRKITLQK